VSKELSLSFSSGLSPRSERFNDFFFADEHGIEAAEYIFIEGSQLGRRLQERSHWKVAELGFGTGMNFFALLNYWVRHAPTLTRLTFSSVEGFPLAPDIFQRALSPFASIAPFVKEFLRQYVSLTPGMHRFEFLEGRVVLYLSIGPAEDALQRLQGGQHCWFLDGFAPARNPEMWTPEIFHDIAERSADGSLLSTWSAAGSVRRLLKEVGFEVQKFPGFQGKRESCRAVFRRTVEQNPTRTAPQRMAVIGAGLAGVLTAQEAQNRGFDVTVFEQGTHPAQGASGNEVGLLYPHIGIRADLPQQLYSNGFLDSVRRYQALNNNAFVSAIGALQSAATPRLQRILLNRANNPNLSIGTVPLVQVREQHPERFFMPAASVVRIAALIRAMKQSFPRCHAPVIELKMEGGLWSVRTREGAAEQFDCVVLAAGWNTTRLAPVLASAIEPVRGEVYKLTMAHCSPHALCFQGYSIPCDKNHIVMGSSYDHFMLDTYSRPRDLGLLLSAAAQAFPDEKWHSAKLIASRVSFRCSTPDRMPLCGEIYPGLLCITALGSRGLTSASILAHDLLAQYQGAQTLLSSDALHALRPARYFDGKVPAQHVRDFIDHHSV
jgi:tRNA 5-methylaminomethyl-2-thiouridine biosynthesis bifunctional protein